MQNPCGSDQANLEATRSRTALSSFHADSSSKWILSRRLPAGGGIYGGLLCPAIRSIIERWYEQAAAVDCATCFWNFNYCAKTPAPFFPRRINKVGWAWSSVRLWMRIICALQTSVCPSKRQIRFLFDCAVLERQATVEPCWRNSQNGEDTARPRPARIPPPRKFCGRLRFEEGGPLRALERRGLLRMCFEQPSKSQTWW